MAYDTKTINMGMTRILTQEQVAIEKLGDCIKQFLQLILKMYARTVPREKLKEELRELSKEYPTLFEFAQEK